MIFFTGCPCFIICFTYYLLLWKSSRVLLFTFPLAFPVSLYHTFFFHLPGDRAILNQDSSPRPSITEDTALKFPSRDRRPSVLSLKPLGPKVGRNIKARQLHHQPLNKLVFSPFPILFTQSQAPTRPTFLTKDVLPL